MPVDVAGSAPSATVALPAPVSQASGGWLLTVLTVAMFSIATPMTKHALVSGEDPLALLSIRMIIGSALIGGWILATSPGRLRMVPTHAGLALLAGISNGVGMVSYFFALGRIDGSIASMIFACSPLCTLGILALRGERISRMSMIRMGVGAAGIWLIVGPSGAVDPLGALGVLVSAITFAIHLAILQWNLKGADGRATTLLIVVGMALVSSLVWATRGGTGAAMGSVGWTTAIVLAIVSTWLARMSLFEAVRRIGSGQVSMLLPLETPLAVTLSVVFRGERPGIWEGVGGLLIVASAALGARRSA